MSLLCIEELSLELGGKAILRDVSWENFPGGNGLLGPNGAGKSTLFKCIMGLQNYRLGRILWRGQDLGDLDMGKRRQKGIAYLAQEPWLFLNLSARKNLLAVAELLGMTSPDEKVDSLLEKVGLKDRATHMASTLSGGEKRRLEIARVLLEEPSLIMMDEPFAGLDPKAIRLLKSLLEELKNEEIHLLISDHQVDHILDVCEKVTLMQEGKVILISEASEFKQEKGAQESYL